MSSLLGPPHTDCLRSPADWRISCRSPLVLHRITLHHAPRTTSFRACSSSAPGVNVTST
ncbi:hypothetical protein Micbo1qcDRAFT_158669, partial [Microdochium bolleyi]